jgi:DnaK suppressor protein
MCDRPILDGGAAQAERLRCERRLERWAQDLANRVRALREAPPVQAAIAKDLEDDAADQRERHIEYAVAQLRSDTLRGIGDALRRLRTGDYGICAECGGAIPRARLAVLPSAVLCVHCQAAREADRQPALAQRAPRIVADPRALFGEEEPNDARIGRRARALLDSAA